MHRRTLVFEGFLAEIAKIEEFAGADKVRFGRKRAIPQELLPAITLTWADAGERSETRPTSGPLGEDGYDRRLSLSVIVHLRDADPELEFDRICTLVEPAMAASLQLGGEIVEATLSATEFFVDRETGLPLGAGRLVYATHYTTLAGDAATAAA